MKKIALLLFIGGVFFTACKKEGCTDSTAANYSSDAKKDDGSCTYESTRVFWYNQIVSDWLYNTDSTTYLNLKIDGSLIGQYDVLTYWTSAPSCGDAGNIEYTLDLGSEKSKFAKYELIDDKGLVIWTNTLQWDAFTCHTLQVIL